MFAKEREEKILTILNDEGRVNVKNLSETFSVTEDCIRKDLKKLESMGKLKRVYGGAIPLRQKYLCTDVVKRNTENLHSKEIISKKALSLLNNKDMIFLDTSSTNLVFAKLLSETNLSITVVTNMIDIVLALKNHRTIKIICTGGSYVNDINGFSGSETINFINQYLFTKAFLGVAGINLFEGYLTDADIEDGNTKKAIIKNSKEIYIVMENKKFSYDSFHKFAFINDINGIITEATPPKSILDEAKDNEILIL
ncbi:DeoR/GlpR family DNA-binding transcription regulator [Clostridium hydrogeniformans]|uniref:DeoR/GlpR family DNA-binding transcription regulator n=1 Tax=Clostridium hydrogeniformans TaxID=349933 RepID=UPI00048985A7|nr:DeoR/GlpR family DNA-binding transcription regulator [Clostridium hydrogeniformans]